MQPDWVWIKNRSATVDHAVFDSVRGVQKQIKSNTDEEELTRTDALSSFDSDGFSIGARTSLNGSGNNIVAWCWKANGSGASNTNGSINTIKTSANTTSGLSINTYTGTGSIATVGHGIGIAPTVLIVKKTGQGANWGIGSVHIDNWTDYLTFTTGGNSDDANFWNDTAPTTTVFSIGSSGNLNTSSQTHVAYCFAPIQGFSKFGSYTGNGNASGSYIHLGFRPAMVILKRTDTTGGWITADNKRDPSNVVGNLIYPNDSTSGQALHTSHTPLDFLSTGMKMRSSNLTGTTSLNISGASYFYMAWAEQPFVNSKGVPCNAR